MFLSRREVLASALAAAQRGMAGQRAAFRIGATDWCLHKAADPASVALSKQLGFDSVQISLGRQPIGDRLPVDNDAVIARYLEEVKKHRFPLDGTCLSLLNQYALKNDKLAQKWVRDAIRLTPRLKTRVILVPFFGNGSLDTRQEMDYVGDLFREYGPEARRAGVILGIESWLSAADNVRIMERAQSPAVLVYYDVGNSTHRGYDVVKEIRWLGRKRICQVHLKEDPTTVRLGAGKIDFPGIVRALAGIGYRGFANLETSSKTEPVDVFMKQDLAYVRGLMATWSG